MAIESDMLLFFAGAFLVGAGLVIGVMVGTAAERSAWVLRGDLGLTHHCDGKFYVVMEEGRFIKDYVLQESNLERSPSCDT